VFCSSIRTTLFAQYFRIVMINFVGNSIKFCCNVTSLMFSLNRFIIVRGKQNSSYIRFLFSISNIKLSAFILFFGFFFNLSRLFQYKEEQIDTGRIFVYDDEEFPTLRDPNEYVEYWKYFYIIFQTLSYILNDIFCSVSILIVDILLVYSLKNNVKVKRLRYSQKTSLKIFEVEMAKRKTIIMIVLNTTSSFLFKTPEFVYSLYFSFILIFSEDLTFLYYFCYVEEICRSLISILDVFYLFSIIFPFLFYCLFNNKFKLGLKNLFKFSLMHSP
jgi:hypothetical protein